MIRLAVPEDFTSLMSIYAYARSFMQETEIRISGETIFRRRS